MAKKKKSRKHQVRAVNPGPAPVTQPSKTCYDQSVKKLKSKLLK